MVQTIIGFFGDLGLWGIFALMAVESSIFPLPSEIILLPASVAAAQGRYSIWLLILAGGFGSVLGASINYTIGKYLGKPFLIKFGKYFFLNHKKYIEAEKLFLRNANLYTFIGRLLPVIRHLISIPAGIFRMPYPYFASITLAGATLWCAILSFLGYFYGESVIVLVERYIFEFKIIIALGVVVFVVWFLKKKR